MIYLGIDDTDSKLGMCTTYLAAVLAERLSGFGLADYPRLIRLNPNIKYKTRGNAALCITLDAGPEAMGEVERIALAAIEEYARFEDENTNPGVIMYAGEITDDLKGYALRVVRDVVEIEEAEALAKKHEMRVHKFKNGRGIVGALASIGLELYDFTYELLAYRMPENYEKPRWLDKESVYAMDAATYPDTWDNVDLANQGDRLFATHAGPCALWHQGQQPGSAAPCTGHAEDRAGRAVDHFHYQSGHGYAPALRDHRGR